MRYCCPPVLPPNQTPHRPGSCTRPSHTDAARASGAPNGARAAPPQKVEAATPRQRFVWDTSSPPCSLHAATQAVTSERRTPWGHLTSDAWPRRASRPNAACARPPPLHNSQAAAHGSSIRVPLRQARQCGEQQHARRPACRTLAATPPLTQAWCVALTACRRPCLALCPRTWPCNQPR